MARLAGALAARGVGKGDRVIVYMPMVPEALVAMLACARLGAIHSVVFGGFAAHELAVRIDDARPKAIIAASCGIEPGRVVRYKPLVDAAIEHGAAQAGVLPRLPARRRRGRAGRRAATSTGTRRRRGSAPAACAPVGGMDPLYILYTSGTTGQPKGVVRTNAGHMVALAWSMRNIYAIEPGEVFWAASDVGWVVGHSYICYAPLLVGATTVVFEGKPVGTPDAGTFWRVIAEHGVRSFFTAPTAFRAIKREDPGGRAASADYDLARLRYLFLAGERADPDTIEWARRQLGVPVIDHWWQTETGWAIAANPAGIELLPVKLGSPTVRDAGLRRAGPVRGGRRRCRRASSAPWRSGCRCRRGRCRRSGTPTSASCGPTSRSFPGYYETGDAGMIDEDGYLYIMARTDDVINVAGHRLSTGAMEEVLAGASRRGGMRGDRRRGRAQGAAPARASSASTRAAARDAARRWSAECVALVRDRIGPVAAFRSRSWSTACPRPARARSCAAP